MKKFVTVLAVATLGLISITAACDNAPCTADADCAGTTNSVGDATPVCDVALGVCTPESEPQCTDDGQCKATDVGGTAACTANADCAGNEACVVGADEEGHCVDTDNTGDCDVLDGDFDFELASGEDVAGNTVAFCADVDVTCGDDGQCEGGTFD